MQRALQALVVSKRTTAGKLPRAASRTPPTTRQTIFEVAVDNVLMVMVAALDGVKLGGGG